MEGMQEMGREGTGRQQPEQLTENRTGGVEGLHPDRCRKMRSRSKEETAAAQRELLQLGLVVDRRQLSGRGQRTPR